MKNVKKLIAIIISVISITAILPKEAKASTGLTREGVGNYAYYTKDGGIIYGWKQIDGKWYYFDMYRGATIPGWFQDDKGKWYYTTDNGYIAQNTTVNGFILDSTGAWTGKVVNSSKGASVKPSQNALDKAKDFSWFVENGNKYFKYTRSNAYTGQSDDEPYVTSAVSIDGYLYFFDENGVLQTGEYKTKNGDTYLLGADGKYIEGMSNIKNPNSTYYTGFALTSKSTTSNLGVKIKEFYNGDNPSAVSTYFPQGSLAPTVSGTTIKCKAGQTLSLNGFQVYSKDGSLNLPNLVITPSSTNTNVAFCGVGLYEDNDNIIRNVQPYIIAKNVGTTDISLSINGEKFNVKVIVS